MAPEIWKQIVDVLPCGVIIAEPDNTLLYMNSKTRTKWLPDLEPGDALPVWIISSAKEKEYIAARNTTILKVFREDIRLDGHAAELLVILDNTRESKNMDEMTIFRKAFDAITDMGLMALDMQGRIILYNVPSARNDNMEQDDVIGRKADEVFVHQTPSTCVEVLRTGRPVVDQEIIYTSRTGKVNYCFGSAYPIKSNGRMLGAFTIIRFSNSVRALLSRTMELQKELNEVKGGWPNGTRYHFEDIIGESEAMRSMTEIARKSAFTPSNVLIYGEPGTGKELVAQSIHYGSPNSGEPFVAINCAAIPDNLLESTLFGTVKGAFTGAKTFPGLFEQAGNGTLFLDEINSMPLGLQAKLLRTLQEKSVRRLGAQSETPVQCRVISSCNKPPLECVQRETLRADLYYRLSVICVEVPPLRDRGDDVILLADYYIRKCAPIYGTGPIKMSRSFQSALRMHRWPGNVRELQHVIESALVILEEGEELQVHHLQPYLRNRYLQAEEHLEPTREDGAEGVGLRERLASFERGAILQALRENDWNISQTARAIGYTRSNLQYRMNKLNILSDD